MDSSESSTEDLDPRALRLLLRNIREMIAILADLTDGYAEMVYEAVHIQLNNVMFTQELVELRLHSEVNRQIAALPGSPPTVRL